MLTAKRLREVLWYSPEIGIFLWRAPTSNRVKVGKMAGRLSKKDGYIRISLEGKSYLAHRLAFLYMTGDWPSGEVDHRYWRPDDNRWKHIRDVTHSLNQAHKKTANRTSKSGVLCIHWDSVNQKWRLQTRIEKKVVGGRFSRLSDAKAAYRAICKERNKR